jgi:tetratricopeptide (TPR) repeat protein
MSLTAHASLPNRLLAGFAIATMLLSTAAAAPNPAAPPRDGREMQAREAYAAGRYQDALDISVKLYAVQLHPNYLRNIGRCQQNLGQPDRAISSFREYLRKAKNLAPGEREEIEGYIKEMEELKRQQAAAARPAAPPPQQPTVPLTPTAIEPTAPPATPLQLTAPPPGTEPAPIYKRWWFWTAVGVAVVGGTAAVVMATRSNKDIPCGEPDRTCN